MSPNNNFNYKFFFLIIFAAFLFPKSSIASTASTNVSISNNAEGSNNNVNVVNEVNTSVNTGGGGESRTDIRIETNGEVKEYHGTGDEDVTIESGNGNNSVRVTNKSGSQSSATISESKDSSPSSTPKLSPTPTPKDKSEISYIKSLINQIRSEIRKIFSLIFGK